MKIAHFSDLHYCQKHLTNVDRAFAHGIKTAIDYGVECAVISGDSFDAAIHLHEPAVEAFIKQIKHLADHMPVLVLQGTFSHDRPGSLNVLSQLGGLFPVYVADKPEQIVLSSGTFYPLVKGKRYPGDVTVFNCLPSLNKAIPEIQERGAAQYVLDLFDKWETLDGAAHVLVSHGTVNGCVTESKHAMISPDHEFSTDQLFSSGCQAVMLGHIHKHQSWRHGSQIIAYAGSISRLVFGHNDPVGFLMWHISVDNTSFEFMPTPAPRLIDITFDGAPVMSELEELSREITADDHVRIRFSIDQDFAHIIDKDQIKELFANASVLKIEATVNPVQSVRAQGIGRAMTLDEKLGYWAITTGDEDRLGALTDRLHLLRSMDVDAICETFEPKKANVKDEQEKAA